MAVKSPETLGVDTYHRFQAKPTINDTDVCLDDILHLAEFRFALAVEGSRSLLTEPYNVLRLCEQHSTLVSQAGELVTFSMGSDEVTISPSNETTIFFSWIQRRPEPPGEVAPIPTQDSEDSIDWSRWHQLLDIRDGRGLDAPEQQEYDRYAEVVSRLDDAEDAIASESVDQLTREHEAVIASIKRLTDALKGVARP